jgi:TPR repeat protein
MFGHDLTHPAAAVLFAAALVLVPPAAFACGWWGDGESDSEESLAVGPGGAPVADAEPVGPEEMARLSTAYRQGNGVPRDLALARQWAQRASEAGHAGAMNDLGQMFEAGHGGGRDQTAAARWFAAAARRGIAGAQHSLAVMLREGRGVARNLVAAEGWLRRSARQGHASAASDLSGMIWSGAVAARSPDEGCFWWLVASREGQQSAAERCRQAQPALSDEALRALQARAAAWVPDREGSDAASREGGS